MTLQTFTRQLRAVFLTGLITLVMAGPGNAAPPPDSVPVSVTGELTVLYMDDFENKRAELQYFIEDKQANRRFRLRFDGTPPGHLRTGKTITVRGRAKGNEVYLAADGMDSSGDAVAHTITAVTGEQRTLVMVANFNDDSVSCPVNEIRDLMFTDAADQSIDDLYQETSYGGIWMTGQVVGPYNINFNSDNCDFTGWADAADAAAQANGINLGAYNRKVYVVPPGSCPAAGIGTVGGNPSRSWVFTCHLADVFGHELGHNLGMHHAGTPTAQYGDNTDIMGIGGGPLRQINAPHKEQMGWLPAMQIENVTQSGTYDIAPLELDSAGAITSQALKIFKADTNEYYYLSYRRGIGFDANLSPFRHLDRLSIHTYVGDGSPSMTYLMDLPTDGESFTDAANGITITQVSHNDDYVTVEVSLNGSTPPPPTCTAVSPQVSLSPPSQSANGGSTLNYSVSLTNTDSSACANSTFVLSETLPTGWSGTVSPASMSLAPGQSGTATLSVTSTASAAASTYSVGINISDGSEPAHAASGSASYTVVQACAPAAPALSLSPASQSGDPGTALTYTVSLVNQDSAACSGITFDLSILGLPDGWSGSLSSQSLSLAPGATGSASLTVTSSATAAAGLHSILLGVADSQEPLHAGSDFANYVVNEITVTEDTEAPTTPAALSASGNHRQVSLSWNPSSDNVGVAGYRVYRDGVAIATTTETGYVDRDGASNVMYEYAVAAFDAADNASAMCAPVTSGKAKAKAKGKGKNR